MRDYIIAIDCDGRPYIAHHGILGQKWGVRRFQNEDGTLTEEGKKRYRTGDDYTIPKGSQFYRISTNNPRGYNPKRGRVYVSTNADDNKSWQRVMTKYNQDNMPLYDVRMKTIREIKVAGETTLGREWINKMLSDENFRNMTERDLVDSKYRFDLNILNDPDGYYDYKDFAKTLGYSTPSSELFFKEMRKKGYGAITDVYGKTSSEEPLIVIKPKKVIKKTSVNKIN